MKKIKQKLVLETKIAYLKNKQSTDFYNLKEQYHQTIESFTPTNIIKNSFKSILSAPNLKANLLNRALNFGVSFISKNTLGGNSENPILGILGKIMRLVFKKN